MAPACQAILEVLLKLVRGPGHMQMLSSELHCKQHLPDPWPGLQANSGTISIQPACCVSAQGQPAVKLHVELDPWWGPNDKQTCTEITILLFSSFQCPAISGRSTLPADPCRQAGNHPHLVQCMVERSRARPLWSWAQIRHQHRPQPQISSSPAAQAVPQPAMQTCPCRRWPSVKLIWSSSQVFSSTTD